MGEARAGQVKVSGIGMRDRRQEQALGIGILQINDIAKVRPPQETLST